MANQTLDRSRLLLKFNVAPGKALSWSRALRSRLRDLGLYIEGTRPDETLAAIHHTGRHLWVRDEKRRAISAARLAAVPAAFGSRLRWLAPAERHGSELVATIPDVLLVVFRHGTDADAAARALAAHGLREWVEKSKYLGRWRFFVVETPQWATARQVASALRKQHGNLIETVSFDYFSHVSPLRLDPNDIFYSRQWAPPLIGAPAAWDIATGAGIVVALIDTGCELAHPDLRFASRGINLDDMTSDATPVGGHALELAHGTLCAGIIGATLDNALGVAGLAGNCSILPLASEEFLHSTVTNGINYAIANGARVINMSFETPTAGFESSMLRATIEDAVARGIVLCASSGNANRATLIQPARHPDVLACGASVESDVRWVSSPTQGSHYGDSTYLGRRTGLSVVAPGLNIFTTDLVGPAGVNPGPSRFDGDYGYFHATSAAGPHVAGLAALILSQDDTLSAPEVRSVIERTAEKVGGYAYRDVDGYPHGTRHAEMGYGRINAHRSLDLGDVMIADWPGDNGVEPSTPPGGVYWTTSDLVVRPGDDGVFDPTDPTAASVLERGREHSIYARVRNAGLADARDVRVDARVTPWVGLEFVYPADWIDEDALHLRPTPVRADLATIARSGTDRARFSLSAAQADIAVGWSDAMMWHPCVLGVVTAENDYAFESAAGGATLQTRRNNLAQRNLTVGTGSATRSLRYPFVVGHPTNRERTAELIIDAGRVAVDGRVQLVLDDNGAAFPALRRAQGYAGAAPGVGKLAGGKPAKRGRRRAITMTQPRMIVELRLPRPGRYPLHLAIKPPRDARPGEQLSFHVAQRSPRRGVVGGATRIHVIA